MLEYVDVVDPFEELTEEKLREVVAYCIEWGRTVIGWHGGQDRMFVELYYQKGLEADEIAAEMQISLKTVYSKKHKIRAHLVRCLQGLTGDSPIADLAMA